MSAMESKKKTEANLLLSPNRRRKERKEKFPP
jgi:hypothetical protein